MEKSIHDLFDLERLRVNWELKLESPQQQDIENNSFALDIFQHFQQLVQSELGHKNEALDELMLKVYELLKLDEQGWKKKERDTKQEMLKQFLDQIEDSLDNLLTRGFFE